MKLPRRIKLDIDQEYYNLIPAQQGDTARVLNFQILNNNIPFSLENKTVRARIKKPDGNVCYNDMENINASEGECDLKLTNQILIKPGMCKAQLEIMENGEILSTIIFAIFIRESIDIKDAAESTNEFTALENGIIKLDEWDRYFKETSGAIEEKYTERLNGINSSLEETKNKIVNLDNSKLEKNVAETTYAKKVELLDKATKEELEVEKERINQFTRLQEGSTTGDAELIDIRVKTDGTTATSAGHAVREQVSELKETLNDEIEKTNIGTYITADLSQTIGVENAYYTNTGGRNAYANTWCTQKFNVKKDEVYYLSGNVANDLSLAMIGVLRTDGINLTDCTLFGNENKSYTDFEVIIPKDGIMIVQSLYTNTLSVKKQEQIKVKDYIDEQIVQYGKVLKGKNLIFDGDSICEDRSTWEVANNGGGYAKLLCDKVGATFVNKGVSGGLLRTLEGFTTESNHSVYDTISTLPTNGDLYCFEGGINDFWQNVELGEVTSGYTDTLNYGTVCGALEGIFRYALNNFVGKPICFIIVHKCQSTAINTNSTGKNFTQYHDEMVKVCNKYSIPYYDAFLESGLNGWNETQSNLYLTANASGTGDGTHPNVEGYKRYYVPQLIELFTKIMPIN